MLYFDKILQDGKGADTAVDSNKIGMLAVPYIRHGSFIVLGNPGINGFKALLHQILLMDGLIKIIHIFKISLEDLLAYPCLQKLFPHLSLGFLIQQIRIGELWSRGLPAAACSQ